MTRILFALGDADYMSSDNKAWRLALKLKQQLGCELIGVSNEQSVADEARKIGLECLVYPFQGTGVTIEQRLDAIAKMIATTKDVVIPGGELPLWKVLALDDFAGSLLLFGSRPAALPACDLILMPMMGVDNNTKGACGLYVWLMSEALKQNIPTLGVEYSPIGNKQTMSLFPHTAFAVKSAFSRGCLIEYGYDPEQIALLNIADSYLIAQDRSDYAEAFASQENAIYSILGIDRKRFLVLIPHHVGFLWEVRKILQSLIDTFQGEPYTVVIKADPNLVRRQYTEVDIVQIVYADEIAKLPHFVIDTQIGFALLVQAADLIIAPLASSLLNWATTFGVPTIISQAAGRRGWEAISTVWEPDAAKIPAIVRSFVGAGLFRRKLADVVERSILAKT